MKVLIVEDEKPAFENLVEELQSIDETISILANCNSVDASIKWLNKNPQPDLILMDIQLSDGLSFNIFKACNITCPVIFTTAYDKYLTQAFEYSSIDYLLKPISQDKLRNAIKKYKALQSHFVNNHSSLTDFLNNHDKKKSRILVKRGMEFQTVRVEDTCYFFTEHKLVFLVDKENRKYMAERNNLTDLEDELDRNIFYRANRKYIINANYVKRFKPLERSKISVELVLPVNEEIIISQENSASFKKWIGEI
jgi:DNA-binding LytR/AlgR family response regulator